MKAAGPFDIRIWFAAASLVAIVAINLVLALTLERYIARRILMREGEVAREFLNSIVSAEDSGEKLFRDPAPDPALASFAAHVRSLPGIIRANIYSLDGFIRYSTEPELTGLKFEDNPELAGGFAGVLSVQLEEASETDKPEHLALHAPAGGQVIEAYIPIAGGNGKTVAVVEFYKLPQSILEIIGEVNRMIWISAAVGGLLLFLVLSGTIAWGARLAGRR